MNEDWIENEFQSADLGDQRLNRRLSLLLDRFAKFPECTINQACESWAET